MGDDDIRLEEFVLCRDGRYHRRDAFGYKVPDCTLQLVRPAAKRSEPAAGDTEAAEAAAAEARAKARAKAAVRMVVPRGAEASIHQMDDEQLNDKVRLLRAMLEWEAEVLNEEGEAATRGWGVRKAAPSARRYTARTPVANRRRISPLVSAAASEEPAAPEQAGWVSHAPHVRVSVHVRVCLLH
jgi:hypothetical protein